MVQYTMLHGKQVLAKWLDHNAAYLIPASATTFFKIFKSGVSWFQLLTWRLDILTDTFNICPHSPKANVGIEQLVPPLTSAFQHLLSSYNLMLYNIKTDRRY